MLDEILKISIKDYLNGIGIETRKEGNRYFCSSPFSRDTNWSFCIYPTNTYFDWANGNGGSIINLYSRINGVDKGTAIKQLQEGIKYEKYKPNYRPYAKQQKAQEPFDYQKYINTNPEECAQIKAYAASRGITEGYFCGVFFTRAMEKAGEMDRHLLSNGKWVRVPALGFLHVDKDLKPCGAKFRRIDNQEPRFSARGALGFYILDTQKLQNSSLSIQEPALLYVVESESSANSLAENLAHLGVSAVVVSRGGVSSAPALEDLPEYLKPLRKKVIIDYDGSEELYQQRIKLYEGLGAEPIKMILPKGEDINSLYCKGEMWKIEHLLL